MSLPDARDIPLDQTSLERLQATGLTYRLVDMADEADGEGFLRADARGFLDAEPTGDVVAQMRETMLARRNVGVFEPDASAGSWPVATVNAWVTPLTVPGGEIGMWAVSSVTVSPTHRRRGIARNLLEGELRAAAHAGVAIAGLTASEATIYGRFGFAPAVPLARVTIDTRRAGWTGAAGAGRVEYVDKETLAGDLADVHERSRTLRAGQIQGWTGRWLRMAGLAEGDSSAASVRGVHHVDADGAVTGVMAYTLAEISGGFRFEMKIRHLAAETPEALRALWRFAVQHDLVDRVSADLSPLDDPIMWLVADPRAVEFTVHDHGWLRILDVAASLGARTYRAPLDVVLRVEDPLGFAAGSWRVAAERDGHAEVSPASDDSAVATLDVAALSALYLGGVSAAQLRAAGRLHATAEVAASLDDAFRTAEAPLLSIWY